MRTKSGCSHAESGMENHRRIGSSNPILNSLPDDIVGNILSRLPTKNAVQTSILSKGWEHKWKLIENFRIDDDCRKSLLGKDGKKCFLTYVDRVLDLTASTGKSKINSFRLSCTKRKYNSDHKALTRWIVTVLKRNVKILDIEVNVEKIALQGCLQNWNSLTELKLSLYSCTLEVRNCVDSLKILHLIGVSSIKIVNNIVGKTAGCLVLTFPVLEELVLKNCIWLNTISVEIRAPALVAFKKSSMRFNDLEIKICGNKLAKFKSDCSEKVVLEAPSVYSVAIDSQPGYDDDICLKRCLEILNAVQGIKFLNLCDFTLTALFKLEPRPAIPTFLQLKQLELEQCRDLKAILELLQMLPVLETLTLTSMQSRSDDGYDQVDALPHCIYSHLKEVKLVQDESRPPVDLAKFILKHASNLERMSIVLHCTSFFAKRKHQRKETEIKAVLSSSTTSSSSLSIVVTHEIYKYDPWGRM